MIQLGMLLAFNLCKDLSAPRKKGCRNMDNSWKPLYDSKLISLDEAAKKIKSGDCIYACGNCNMPIDMLEALAARRNDLEHVTVIGSTSLAPHTLLKDPTLHGKIDYISVFGNGYDGVYNRTGNVTVNSIMFSRLGQYITDIAKANVVMAQVSPPDEEGYLYYSLSGTAMLGETIKAANLVILEVNKYHLHIRGKNNRIHINEVDFLVESDVPLPEYTQSSPTEEELKMVEFLLPLIHDGDCLQLGVGGLPNALGYRLTDRKNLHIHTEMYTDSMAYLARKGVITGKQVAGFAMGTREMYDYVAEGNVELAPSSYVNDPYVIGKIDNFVSINACIMADLTGQVCSEAVGHRQISGVGGQVDFVRGAALSKGGRSFLCMTSVYTSKDGKRDSRIKVTLPPGSVVTTPRCDVMYIVTEYGIANLWLKPIPERIEAMINIAHPDFREQLRKEAIEVGLLREW